MTGRKIIISGLLITAFLYKKSEAQDTTVEVVYTLQQCIDIAIKNNPDVKNSEFQMQTDEANWQRARGNMFPTLGAYVSHNIANGKSINPYTNSYIDQQYTAANYQLTANVVLWNGSSIQHFIKQQALQYKAGQMDWQQAKDKLTINVILDYLAVLNEQEQLKLAQQQAGYSSEEVRRLTIENNKGNISPSDLYDMKGQLSGDTINILSASNQLEQDKLALAQLMNIPYSTEMSVQPIADSEVTAYTATVDDIYQYALQNLAMVKAADLHERSAQFGVKAARGNMLPTLSLSGGMFTNYSSAAFTSQLLNTSYEQTDNYVLINNNQSPVYSPVSNYQNSKIPYGSQWKNNLNSDFSLNLSIPILNGLQARTNLRLAKINEQQTSFQAQTVKIQLKQAIEQDYLNMTTAYATYQQLVEQAQDYAEAFRSAKIKFDAGALSETDYVTGYIVAKSNLDQAQTRLIAAKYNYILQKKILDYYGGTLTTF